jgi:outer membrane protein, heavy metal efflux system
MAGDRAILRLGIQTLAGFFLILWFGAAVGCRTQRGFEHSQQSAVTSLPTVAAGPKDAAQAGVALSPDSNKPEPLPPTQGAASPLTQTSHQAPADPAPAVKEIPKLPRELTLEQVFDCTLQNHPALRAKKEEVEAARARLITAGLKPNPQFVFNTDSEVAGEHAVDINTRLEFTLETAGKRRLRQDAAKAEIARTQWDLNAETERILIEAADAAWEVLYLQELSDLEAKLHDMAAKTAELQRSRPDVSYADRIEADTDAAELELDRLESTTALEIAHFRLSQAIGLDYPEALHMQGQLPVRAVKQLSYDDFLSKVRQCRPQLGRAQAGVAESECLHRLECAKAKPDIGLGPRYRENFDNGVDRLGLRFDADLPLFNRNQGGIRESAAEIRRQAELFRVICITTLTDAASAYRELLELQKRLQYYRAEVIPLAERTEATIHDAFAARQIKADQMSILQRNFVRLRLKELALRYRFNRLSTRLEIFLGEPIVVP